RDGTLVRHLHDLAAIEARIAVDRDFFADAWILMYQDLRRAKTDTTDLATVIAEIGATLDDNPVWMSEYETFVGHLSYAADQERITFEAARACWNRLTGRILDVAA
ncbi:MAG TPA: hypothetical protein VK943_13485, partial [Arenibaculum sp.]|nr:hypothetical protein [Arenibaculum sp.]